MKKKTSKNTKEARSLQAVDRPLAGDMRSPLAKARDEWLASAEGEKCSNPLTLKTTADQRQYLENRLVSAFLAGADWMERHKHGRKRPIATAQAAPTCSPP